MKKFFQILIFALMVLSPLLLRGASLNHANPKLANLFYRWHIEENEVADLARWDILIVDMDVQTYSPEKLVDIKRKNPQIKLLAYLAPEEVRGDSGKLDGTLRQKFYNLVDEAWWLKDSSGQAVAWWKPNPMINVTADAPLKNGQTWSEVLPRFIKNEILASGYWDGVFYDNVWDDVSFLQSFKIDTNLDGQPESVSELNQKWQAGMSELLSQTRNILGDDYLILGNGGESYFKYVNGTLYETFPIRGWSSTMEKYRFITENGASPAIGVLNTNGQNSNKKDNYQLMRYGLASALLADGYSGFDNGDQSHAEIWWYDEYETSLGDPKGQPVNILNSQTGVFSDGVWRRDFENGLVIANSTDRSYSVDLGGEFQKINGKQAKLINDGSFVERVEVPAKDGLLLLRPIENIYKATFFNGSFVRVFNEFGHHVRAGFFAYKEDYRGGTQIIEEDLDRDKVKEVVVAEVNRVDIYEEGVKVKTFYPYTEKYRGGINIAVGDLDNNGTMEIITGTENGGGPQVRIFNNRGDLINPGFFAYGKEFRGGVNIAVGDLEGDGAMEIIAGAGVGGGPHVRVFAADGKLVNPGFFAYDSKFRGGVNVAVGDMDGDGKDEIITGAGKGGGPQIKVFDKAGKIAGPIFFAFDDDQRQGVEVATTDMDGDGKAEIIGMTSDVFTVAGF